MIFRDGSSPRKDVFVRLRSKLARGTEDDTNGTFATDKGKTGFFFESEHDEGKTKSKGLSRTCERNPDHVSTREAMEHKCAVLYDEKRQLTQWVCLEAGWGSER